MPLKISLLVFSLVMFIPDLAKGAGNLHIGPLEIHPYVSVREAYSDNIYATANERKSDSITTTIPGLRLDLPFRMHGLVLDYNAVITNHATYTADDTTDQNARGILDLKLGSQFGLSLSNFYTDNHEPRGSSSTGFIEKYNNNVATASVAYQLADVSKIEISYTRSVWEFKTSKFRDRNEDMASAYLYYQLLPKTSAFIEYDHKIVDFTVSSQDLNNDVNNESLGITWASTEKSKGTIKVGYLQKNFAKIGKTDYTTWTTSVDLSHELSNHTSLTITGQRAVNEANLQGTNYLVSTGAYAELKHKFIQKLTAVVKGSIGTDDFSDIVPPETEKRQDLTTMGGMGLKYLIQDWLETAIDYSHTDRNSNMDTNDYWENSYMFTINVVL